MTISISFCPCGNKLKELGNPKQPFIYCDDCRIERRKKRKREYNRRNQKKLTQQTTEWKRANRARVLAWQRQYREKNRQYLQELGRKYRKDPSFRLASALRCRIRAALKGIAKSAKTEGLLGCSIPHFREWFELKFKPGMTWENYGQWHVDHIRPCNSFDLTDPKQQEECFNYLNLQPLWASENLAKHDKWE